MVMITVERVEEWIDDKLIVQFEAIEAEHPVTSDQDGAKVSAEAQQAMTELCGDDHGKLHQLRAWLFLCREMSPKMTISAIKQGCPPSELMRLARASGASRHRRDPDRHQRFTGSRPVASK